MKLSVKLYAATGSLVAVGAALVATSIFGSGAIEKRLQEATSKTAVKLDLVNAMREGGWEMIACQRGVFVNASLKEAAVAERIKRQWGAALARQRELAAEARPLLITSEGRSNLQKMEAATNHYEPLAREYMRLAEEQKFEDAGQVMRKIEPIVKEMNDAGDELIRQQRDFLNTSRADAASVASTIQIANIAAVLALIGVAAGAVWAVRGISGTLQMMIGELSVGAEQVASAAAQVASSSQALAQGSSEQAASLEETSASTEEISSMSRRNTDSSCTAADLVSRSQQKTGEANHSLEAMVTAMSEINAQSDRISRIIKVIDEIAFQTNILALNAAVEAARAGEAGMGFAVVADEVRSLAQRCAQAARDTAVMIEESIAKSNDGKHKVDDVARAIREVTDDVGRVKALVDQVNMGSQEQMRGLEQIGRAISQMESVTQTTAANAEETASASEELTAQSHTLRGVVVRLTEMVRGSAAD